MYRVIKYVVNYENKHTDEFYVMEGLTKEQAEELAENLNIIDTQVCEQLNVDIENKVEKEETND